MPDGACHVAQFDAASAVIARRILDAPVVERVTVVHRTFGSGGARGKAFIETTASQKA